MKVYASLFIISLTALFSSGCSNTSTSSSAAEDELRAKTGFHQIPLGGSGAKHRKLVLWPGKEIEIISIKDVTLQTSGQPVKHLTYRTKLPITMGSPLKEEMLEVSSRFTVDLTVEKRQIGMVTAVETPQKGAKQLMTYTRAYLHKDNKWVPIVK